MSGAEDFQRANQDANQTMVDRMAALLARATAQIRSGAVPPSPRQLPEAESGIMQAARKYINRGWRVVPVPFRRKAPDIKDWDKLTLTERDLPGYFADGNMNIGLIQGDRLVDVDLDSPQALAVADAFLPPTGLISGRASSPRSHRWYTPIGSGLKSTAYDDPVQAKDRRRLLELRTGNHQTIVPPSVHPEGELIVWHQQGDPAPFDTEILNQAVRKTAAAALLVRYWPKPGSRHEAALALAGGLLRRWESPDEVAHFVRIVASAAGDDEVEDRVRAVQSSAEQLKQGEPATGLRRLGEIIDPKVMDRIAKWLDLEVAATDANVASRNDQPDSVIRYESEGEIVEFGIHWPGYGELVLKPNEVMHWGGRATLVRDRFVAEFGRRPPWRPRTTDEWEQLVDSLMSKAEVKGTTPDESSAAPFRAFLRFMVNFSHEDPLQLIELPNRAVMRDDSRRLYVIRSAALRNFATSAQADPYFGRNHTGAQVIAGLRKKLGLRPSTYNFTVEQMRWMAKTIDERQLERRYSGSALPKETLPEAVRAYQIPFALLDEETE